jgi:D-alanyl-lipoteichoic acid acyltransferase DltB (MBOAT superfamily)
MAVGISKMVNITLPINFDSPYKALSIRDFWKRWHISLTHFLTKYVYIPLGGNRKGKVRTCLNIMIVFLVSGLWHGASFSYVIWGGLNGFYQIAGEITRPLRQRILKTLKIKETSKPHRFLQGMITFRLIDFSWMFFCAGSFRDALTLLREMCSNLSLRFFADGSLFNCGLDQPTFLRTVACILLLLFADICRRKGLNLRKELANQKAPVRCVFLVAAVCFILIFGVWGARYDASAFIYFQF